MNDRLDRNCNVKEECLTEYSDWKAMEGRCCKMKDYSEQHKKPGSMMRTTSGSGMKEHWKEEQKKTLRILQKESHQQFEECAPLLCKEHATELSQLIPDFRNTFLMEW